MADEGLRLGEELGDLLRWFRRRTGLHQKQLNAALRLHRGESGERHLGRFRVARLLADRLSPVSLASVAVELSLGPDALARLLELSRGIRAAVHGGQSVLVEPPTTLEAALVSAEVGDALTDRDEWDIALAHLMPAWGVLWRAAPQPGEYGFHRLVRTGTQLASILDYQGRHGLSSDIMTRLLRRLDGVDTSKLSRPTAKAVALAYKGAAVSLRHGNRETPRYLVALSDKGYRLLTASEQDPCGQASALRDQARPYLAWRRGYWERGRPDGSAGRFALCGVKTAIRILESVPAEDWVHGDLLMTRVDLAITCGCLDDREGAARAWEGVEQLLQAGDSPAPDRVTPLRSKYLLGEMFMSAVKGDWDEVVRQRDRFRRITPAGRFQERLDRADELAAAAATECFDLACRAMVR